MVHFNEMHLINLSILVHLQAIILMDLLIYLMIEIQRRRSEYFYLLMNLLEDILIKFIIILKYFIPE